MSGYFLAAVVILFINLLPAFAPPTWAVLLYFVFTQNLNPWGLILIGLICATAGRAGLALYFRKLAFLFPDRFLANMESLASLVEASRGKLTALLAIFFFSPGSSAQLFEAAGMIKGVRLKPLLLVFAAGRSVSYTFYVFGAQKIHGSSLGEVMGRYMTSPQAIIAQVAFIVGLVVLGNVNWSRPKP